MLLLVLLRVRMASALAFGRGCGDGTVRGHGVDSVRCYAAPSVTFPSPPPSVPCVAAGPLLRVRVRCLVPSVCVWDQTGVSGCVRVLVTYLR